MVVLDILGWFVDFVAERVEWLLKDNRPIFVFGGLIGWASYRIHRLGDRKGLLAIEFRHMVGRQRAASRQLRSAGRPVTEPELLLPSTRMLREPFGVVRRCLRTLRYGGSGLCIRVASGGVQRFGLQPLEHFSMLGYFAKQDRTFDVVGFWVSTGSPREAINDVLARYRYPPYTPDHVSAGTIPARLSANDHFHVDLDDDSYLVLTVTPRWHHRLRRLRRPRKA